MSARITDSHGDHRGHHAAATTPGLPALLHLCDSLFPTGAYAHSDGLEAATDAGQVVTGEDLRAWMLTLRDETLRRTDGPAIYGAWAALAAGDWPRLRQIDDELHAMRPAATVREASRGVGSRLLRTWGQIYPSPRVNEARARASAWTLPVAFTIAARETGTDARTTVEAYSYTRLAGTAAAAMRLMRIGQVEAHTVLAEVLAGVPVMTAAMVPAPVAAASPADSPAEAPAGGAATASANALAPSAFLPLADIAAMRQQYVTTRLFRS